MKLKRISLAVASGAALAAAGMYPVIVSDWFSQTFRNLADGTSFTGTQGGTSGGTWTAIDAGVATVATVSGRKCIEVDTSKSTAADASLRFTASANAPTNIERFEFAICTEPMPWYPMVSSDEKGALVLMSNDGGQLAFGGYTKSGWTTMYGHGFTQHTREWIDCRAEFDYSESTPTVTYYAKLSDGGDYQPLADADGNTSFAAANATVKTKVLAFEGKGAIGDFAGKGLAKDSGRVKTWKGSSGGDWDTAGNWSPAGVPADGDMAVIGTDAVIRRTVGGKTDTIVVYGAAKIVLVSGESMSVESGDVELFGDFTAWGTIIVAPKAKLRAQGTFYGIEMGCASTLQVVQTTNVTVTTRPIHLEGVNVSVPSEPSSSLEAVALVKGPYGSGGTPASLKKADGAGIPWTAAWHGRLDGTSALWISNNDYPGLVATWNGGAWGNLANTANWDKEPGAGRAAKMPYGQAHVNQWDTFPFARRFEVGTQEDKDGEVDMSGGTVLGASVVVGTGYGSGLLDIVGGTVRPLDHLWDYAVTVGTDSHASGTVRVRGGILDVAGGGVSVGAAGAAARMEICEGRATAGGPFAVGYAGKLDVTGGSLTVSNSVFIGRTTRDESYDVAMTVSGGAVSNVAEGAFCVGSYGGVGSKAVLTLAGGEVYAAERFVCGGYRSGRVDVTGGTLVAPEICVGQDLVGDEDTAAFNLVSGRVVTAGFTSGAKGTRTVSLADGELTATAANGDFFRGIDTVRLEDKTAIGVGADVTVKAGLTGPGGFVKTGAGTLTVGGYAAWAGKTTVAEGTLDMGGGMVMGELDIAEGASVRNAKYDDIDALGFSETSWTSGTVSSKKYLRISATRTATAGTAVRATDGDGVLKGAISFAAAGGGLTFAGWSAFGWTNLGFADGVAVAAGKSYDVQMKFDFDGKQYYVMYYAKRDGVYERLVSAEGLRAFPVAGSLASVKTFDGTGAQLTVDATKVCRWTGGARGDWNVGGNWSTGTMPGTGAAAFVDTPATIDVPVSVFGASVATLVANARVTLANGTLTFSKGASGAGTLVLSNATLNASAATATVALPVLAAAGTDNAVEGAVAKLDGALKGAGGLSASARLCGDTQAFEGRLDLFDGSVGSVEASRNARSAWTVSGYPFGVSDNVYEFGALGGSFAAKSGDAANVTLSVGARNEDCALGGSWLVGSGCGLDWTAATATMTYDVANSSFLRLSGGGKVVIGSADCVPGVISFRNRGGTLAFASGAAYDPSALLRDSTAPMAFDDGGGDGTWAAALDASNVGGFVKRGAGTLTLAAAPKYRGETVVEEGVLVVPFGTRLDGLTVARAGKLVLDMGGSAQKGIALSIARANRELNAKYFSVSNAPADYKVEPNGNNGLVISVGAASYSWTGKENSSWTNVRNWSVGGQTATVLPQEQDDVRFFNTVLVTIDRDVAVRNITCDAGLIVQSSNAVSVAGSVQMTSGQLTFGGNVSLEAADLAVAALGGTGTVQVASGSLVLSPTAEMEPKFVGTLNVTNFVKAGDGVFEYEPTAPFAGTVSVAKGTFRWNCSSGDMTNQVSAALAMSAGANLDLCGQTVTVGSFCGAGTVANGLLVTADGVVTQSGGALTIPAVHQATYVASHAGEALALTGAADKDVRIAIPRDWFVAGMSGKRAVFCESRNIVWDIRSKTATKPLDEGNGWWSIAGGGFTVRLR